MNDNTTSTTEASALSPASPPLPDLSFETPPPALSGTPGSEAASSAQRFEPGTCNAQPATADQCALAELLAPPLSTKNATALATLDSAPPSIAESGNLQLSTSSPRKLRRNGRVARLPKNERDLVNRMLWNNVPYKNIVAALDDVGYTLTERNISNWATGGYLEWRVQQEAVLQNRLDQDHLVDFLRRENAGEIPEVGLQAAATRLSQVLLHKLATAENPEKHIDEYSKMVDLLSRLNREINNNQKLRDDSRRTLGREYDPVRVREDNEIDILEQERYSTPGPDPKNRDATTPFLHPLPMSTVNARDNEYDRQQRALEFQKHSLNLLKLTTERGKAKNDQGSSSTAA